MMTDKKRIICIEDEPETTNLMKLILAREGYEVLGANGGEEGLALVDEHSPDLILLDLMMPEMDGTQVFQRLKENEKTRDIPVIVVTAKVQSIDIVLWRQVAKVDDYITKPFRPEELAERVKYVLAQAGEKQD
jgi:two-component system response regulator VicR